MNVYLLKNTPTPPDDQVHMHVNSRSVDVQLVKLQLNFYSQMGALLNAIKSSHKDLL